MTKSAVGAAGGLAALAVVACSAGKPASTTADAAAGLAAEPAGNAAADDFQSIKVGAAVDVSHQQTGAVDPGSVGVVTFTMNEPYDGGTMAVVAAGSAGLDLVPPSPSTTIAIGAGASHQWDVSFRAATAGVYYIDLSIKVTSPTGATEMRSYSARVDVGAGGGAQKAGAKTGIVNGEPVVVMDAEESVND
jgi:hypothetical protein